MLLYGKHIQVVNPPPRRIVAQWSGCLTKHLSVFMERVRNSEKHLGLKTGRAGFEFLFHNHLASDLGHAVYLPSASVVQS